MCHFATPLLAALLYVGVRHLRVAELVAWANLQHAWVFLQQCRDDDVVSFNAFGANPRLNVVINTIQEAAFDRPLFVFFMSILVFAHGTVMFGSLSLEFSASSRSIMTCWRTLLGNDLGDDVETGGVFAQLHHRPRYGRKCRGYWRE